MSSFKQVGACVSLAQSACVCRSVLYPLLHCRNSSNWSFAPTQADSCAWVQLRLWSLHYIRNCTWSNFFVFLLKGCFKVCNHSSPCTHSNGRMVRPQFIGNVILWSASHNTVHYFKPVICPPLRVLCEQTVIRQSDKILSDLNHVLHSELQLLPSGSWFRARQCKLNTTNLQLYKWQLSYLIAKGNTCPNYTYHSSILHYHSSCCIGSFALMLTSGSYTRFVHLYKPFTLVLSSIVYY